MLPRTLPGLLSRRFFSVSARMASATPIEDVMRDKVFLPLAPASELVLIGLVVAGPRLHAVNPSHSE